MRTVPQNTYVTVSMSGPTSIVEPCSPWRALAQSGISMKWEDPRTTWSGCLKRNPRPSGRGVCQI